MCLSTKKKKKKKSLLLFCVSQILRVLGESAIAVRTKAMKCLSEVVAVDPSILARVSAFSQTRHKYRKENALKRVPGTNS